MIQCKYCEKRPVVKVFYFSKNGLELFVGCCTECGESYSYDHWFSEFRELSREEAIVMEVMDS